MTVRTRCLMPFNVLQFSLAVLTIEVLSGRDERGQ